MRPGARPGPGLRAPFYAGMRWSSKLDGVPAGDMYLIVMNKSFWHEVGSRVGLLSVWVNKSYSTGVVRLNPTDPMAEPDVDFDMCSDWRDMERLVQGTRMMIRVQARPEFRAAVHEVFPISYSDRARKYAVYNRRNAVETWIGARLMDSAAPLRRLMINTLMADGPTIADLESDPEAMSSWIRRSVLGHYHASCTCRMGAPDDPKAVTDPSGRVYGVTSLRIADASLFPAVPCANTNFPTIMVGEKMAATVLGEG
jgi:5-(hydroxymethyl)furfural/furfural oxidase